MVYGKAHCSSSRAHPFFSMIFHELVGLPVKVKKHGQTSNRINLRKLRLNNIILLVDAPSLQVTFRVLFLVVDGTLDTVVQQWAPLSDKQPQLTQRVNAGRKNTRHRD